MKEEKRFETESQQLLDLMINSIYSQKEIFLRELLSNASDAIDKYRYISLQNPDQYPTESHQIVIEKDKKARTISIIDNGIGMTLEDLEKNLGTIAKSGSKEFMEKWADAKEKEDLSIIGQFGVGFYSAFMVADSVDVLSCALGEPAHRFYSEGKSTYTVEDAEAPFAHGTRVTIHLKEDKEDERYSDYLEDYRIESLVKKYSDYIRYPIVMEVEKGSSEDKHVDEKELKTLNSMVPLWKKSVSEVKEEDLKEFYKSKFVDMEDPDFSLNVHVEGLYSYEALLFIPSHVPYDFYSESYEQGLSLYSHGIFIQDHYKDLVPNYLRFVKGLVDSDDFPLNVSREMLQKTPEMGRIAKNIESKVLSELKKTKKNDKEKYEKFFKMFGEHLKYGIYSSYGLKKDELQDLLLFHHLGGEEYVDLETYVKDLDKKAPIYFASGKNLSEIKMLPQLEKYKKDGIDVLLLDKNIDEFTVMAMMNYAEHPFKDVSSEAAEVSKEKKKELDQFAVDHRRLLDNLKESLGGKVDDVIFSDKLVDSPVCLSTKEGLSMNAERVIKEEPGEVKEDIKSTKVLEINPDHALFKGLATIENDEEAKSYGSLLYDEAMLLQGYDIEDKAAFVAKLNDLMVKAMAK